jgi:hypothetical protein
MDSVKNSKELGRDLLNRNGTYALELIIGDPFISNSLDWKIADAQFTFPAEVAVVPPRSPFAVLPEIRHEFRPADARAPWYIAQAFTGVIIALFVIMVLAVNQNFLLLLLLTKQKRQILAMGNLKGFPTGGSFLFAVGFHACFGLILAIYVLHWLSLTMVQTVVYLGFLSVPTFFFAQKALASSPQKAHSE